MTSDAQTLARSPESSKPYLAHDRPAWRRYLLRTESALILLLILVLVFSSIFIKHFNEPVTYTNILLNTAPILLIVLPVTLIIVTGDIDLSVGSTLGISSATLGLLFDAGVPLPIAALIAVASGAVIGLFNGIMVTTVGLPAIAVTIGTLALFRGIAVGLLGTTAITDFPGGLTTLANDNIPGTPIPLVTIAIVVLAIVFAVLLHFTSFGRGVFAIGLSAETATFSGVRVGRTRMLLFLFSGLVASLTGVFYTVQYDNAIGTNGLGYELQVVTAIVLGGVSIWGGRGTILGGIVGALLIGTLGKALQLANVGSDGINVITGAVLILSVGVASIAGFVSRRRRGKASATSTGGD